jgi:hypothetical protein
VQDGDPRSNFDSRSRTGHSGRKPRERSRRGRRLERGSFAVELTSSWSRRDCSRRGIEVGGGGGTRFSDSSRSADGRRQRDPLRGSPTGRENAGSRRRKLAAAAGTSTVPGKPGAVSTDTACRRSTCHVGLDCRLAETTVPAGSIRSGDLIQVVADTRFERASNGGRTALHERVLAAARPATLDCPQRSRRWFVWNSLARRLAFAAVHTPGESPTWSVQSARVPRQEARRHQAHEKGVRRRLGRVHEAQRAQSKTAREHSWRST